MKTLTNTETTAAPVQTIAPGTQITPTHDTADFDALTIAMAEQGLFGKLRIGASLLLFGEANIGSQENPH